MPRPSRLRPPLDSGALRALALHYVGRYATTEARLARYLRDKLRERGWAEEAPADPARLAAEFAERGYVDDAAFAEQRGDAMRRRGLGARRIDLALRAAGIAEPTRAAASRSDAAMERAAAVAFARRRRLGPFAAMPADRAGRQRELAAMLRAGHAFTLARAVLDGDDEDDGDRHDG